MSYIRFSDDSEVYAWDDGEKITCMVTWDLQDKFPDKHFTNTGELFRYLMYLRDNGVKVPNYAIVNIVQRDVESKLRKNATFPFVTQKTMYQSVNDSLNHLCPEINDEDDGESPLLNNVPEHVRNQFDEET